MSSKTSTPGVYIIESTKLVDEEENRKEGESLQSILRLTKRPVIYQYIRTEKELVKMLSQFRGTTFRYLHLACHGNRSEIALTLDSISLRRLADLLTPHMDERRLFISACEGAQSSLATPLLNASSCFSVAGPATDIDFDVAALVWASFYTLMSKTNPRVMKLAIIRKNLRSVCDFYKVSFNFFYKDRGVPHQERIRPDR